MNILDQKSTVLSCSKSDNISEISDVIYPEVMHMSSFDPMNNEFTFIFTVEYFALPQKDPILFYQERVKLLIDLEGVKKDRTDYIEFYNQNVSRILTFLQNSNPECNKSFIFEEAEMPGRWDTFNPIPLEYYDNH